MNIYIETYGCSANQAESEIMAGLLKKSGFDIVKNIDIANVAIVNTCYVKSPTEQKVLFRIKDIQEKYPDKKLIIAGCMPEGAYERIIDIAPNSSLISTHHITKIPTVVKKTLEGKRIEALGYKRELKLCLPRIRNNPVIDIVPISSGCKGNCTYCAVRLAKGRIISYPRNKILDEISMAVKQGCKEIWLTAQDTAAYGLDTHKKSRLPLLLKDISKIPGNFFVRIGMMNPDHVKSILSELISSYNNKKIYKFLHIPVQSGDDEVLENMNRRYTVKEFEEIAEGFKDSFRIQLWTDVIVGFPGETEDQFRNTMSLIKRVKPDWTNVSRYGMRPGTIASKLIPLPSEIVKERSRKMSNLAKNIAYENNKKWVGWKGEVLISERGKKEWQWIGRNFAYKQVIINKRDKLLGKKIKVKIIDAVPTALVGWPIK